MLNIRQNIIAAFFREERHLQALSVCFCLLLLMSSCAIWKPREVREIGYDLEAPDMHRTLPSTLHEISGITQITADTFACIQDEKGTVFLIDVTNGNIIKQLPFFGDGDYEGIARVNNTLYILRSDGTIFEIPNFRSPEYGHLTYETGIPANNNEGLCYDAAQNRLLIACKSNIGKGAVLKNVRAIYAFDLSTKKLSDVPVFELNIETLQAYANTHELDIPTKNKKHKKHSDEPDIKFRTSAIAIHPVNGRLYALSAIDHLLCILNTDGSVYKLIKLDEDVFNKAEGIAFANDNSMLITNEGQDKQPTLLSFSYTGRK